MSKAKFKVTDGLNKKDAIFWLVDAKEKIRLTAFVCMNVKKAVVVVATENTKLTACGCKKVLYVCVKASKENAIVKSGFIM